MIHHETRARLTFTYLAIIMVLSLSFSVIFYHESTRAAGGGFRRQASLARDSFEIFPIQDELDRMRDNEIRRFNNDLVWRLLFLNSLMLAAGVAVSSYLARRSLEPMEEAIEAQSRFTSDAAHELRTPLTAMKTEIEVALRAGTLKSAEAKEILSSNLEEVAKLETLTAALLRLAKNGHKLDSASVKNVSSAPLLKDAYERVKARAELRSITFNLPEPSVKLRGDRDQLLELFATIFDNAVKYGTDNTAVDVTLEKKDDTATICIADKGIGIKAPDLERIFERFYRADESRTKATATGYGLGLSLASAIAKAHGGAITAESIYGKGTTFIVTLPAAN